jgi:glyoxylase-like metal-dependent hydrolase (beta-lactamase superfamily II)
VLRADSYGPVTRIDLSAGPAAGVRWSACYLVDGILFDAAMHHGRDELAAFVDGRAATVALTHCHEDHSGGASALASTGSRVLAPADHLGLLAEPEELPVSREAVWGRPEPVAGAPLPDELVEAGRRYEVLATPGHCPQHVAFVHRDEGWVFGGDLITATKPRFARAEEDLRALVASLRAVAALGPERLFLAHLPVPERPTEPIERLLGYLEDRAAEVRALAGDGAAPEEIVERAFGGEYAWIGPGGTPMPAKDLTGGDFSTLNLVRGLLAL